MQDYTKEELDKKIESFLARKFQKYPELARTESRPRRTQRKIREPRGLMHAFIPTQLKVQF